MGVGKQGSTILGHSRVESMWFLSHSPGGVSSLAWKPHWRLHSSSTAKDLEGNFQSSETSGQVVRLCNAMPNSDSQGQDLQVKAAGWLEGYENMSVPVQHELPTAGWHLGVPEPGKHTGVLSLSPKLRERRERL